MDLEETAQIFRNSKGMPRAGGDDSIPNKYASIRNYETQSSMRSPPPPRPCPRSNPAAEHASLSSQPGTIERNVKEIRCGASASRGRRCIQASWEAAPVDRAHQSQSGLTRYYHMQARGRPCRCHLSRQYRLITNAQRFRSHGRLSGNRSTTDHPPRRRRGRDTEKQACDQDRPAMMRADPCARACVISCCVLFRRSRKLPVLLPALVITGVCVRACACARARACACEGAAVVAPLSKPSTRDARHSLSLTVPVWRQRDGNDDGLRAVRPATANREMSPSVSCLPARFLLHQLPLHRVSSRTTPQMATSARMCTTKARPTLRRQQSSTNTPAPHIRSQIIRSDQIRSDQITARTCAE